MISAGAVSVGPNADRREPSSNYGLVTVSAPVCTSTTGPNNGYIPCYAGTSAAAPIVAGVISMVKEAGGSPTQAFLRQRSDPRTVLDGKDVGPTITAWATVTGASGSYSAPVNLNTWMQIRYDAGGPLINGAYCPWDDGGIWCHQHYRLGNAEWWTNGDAVFDLAALDALGRESGANRDSNFVLCDHVNCLSKVNTYDISGQDRVRAWRKVGTGSEGCPDGNVEGTVTYCYSILDLRIGPIGTHYSFQLLSSCCGTHEVFRKTNDPNYPYVFIGR